MKMKRWILALLVVVMAASWSTSSFAIGCVRDPEGHVECAKQCAWTNVCYSNSFPRYYYCYVYDTYPFGCWHDGTYEPCCEPKRTF